ncbi:hypothetical protein H6G15_04200 [Calothrix sp. FACHB-168]|nr:hypothetical protein [Calothrix sp. FACHB-168]
MHSIGPELVESLNGYIEEQKKADGEAIISIMQFDEPGQHEYLVENANLKEVSKITGYRPRGSTALYDAIIYFFDKTGKYLASLREEDRPATVVITVMTDGENNSSENTIQRVNEVINHQVDKYNWVVNYLGVSELGKTEARNMGIKNVIATNYASAESTEATFKNLSRDTVKLRSQKGNYSAAESFTTRSDYSTVED